MTRIEDLCRQLTQAIHDDYCVVIEGVFEGSDEPCHDVSYKRPNEPDREALRDLQSFLLRVAIGPEPDPDFDP